MIYRQMHSNTEHIKIVTSQCCCLGKAKVAIYFPLS